MRRVCYVTQEGFSTPCIPTTVDGYPNVDSCRGCLTYEWHREELEKICFYTAWKGEIRDDLEVR